MFCVIFLQNDSDDVFTTEVSSHIALRRCQTLRSNVVRSGYCVKQGNVVIYTSGDFFILIYEAIGYFFIDYVHILFQRKSWKRRYFILDDQTVSYYKNETVSQSFFFFLAF